MRWFVRRLAFYVFALWVAVTLNFLLPRLMPGDPLGALMQRLPPSPIQSPFPVPEQEPSLEVAAAPWVAVALPDLGAVRALVLDSVPSPHSRRAYGQALDHFLSWYRETTRGLFRRALVQE